MLKRKLGTKMKSFEVDSVLLVQVERYVFGWHSVHATSKAFDELCL